MTFICTKSCFSVLIHTRHWFFWRNNSLRYSSSLFHYEPWRRCCSFHPEFWKPCLSFPSPQTIAWGCPRQHESCGEKVGPGLGAGAAPNAEDPTRSPPPIPHCCLPPVHSSDTDISWICWVSEVYNQEPQCGLFFLHPADGHDWRGQISSVIKGKIKKRRDQPRVPYWRSDSHILKVLEKQTLWVGQSKEQSVLWFK